MANMGGVFDPKKITSRTYMSKRRESSRMGQWEDHPRRSLLPCVFCFVSLGRLGLHFNIMIFCFSFDNESKFISLTECAVHHCILYSVYMHMGVLVVPPMCLKNGGDNVEYGWLMKKGEKRRNWKRRFFVLQRFQDEFESSLKLHYFEGCHDSTPLGTVFIEPNCHVNHVAYQREHEGYQHCFEIDTPTRTYCLLAMSKQEADKWVSAICDGRVGINSAADHTVLSDDDDDDEHNDSDIDMGEGLVEHTDARVHDASITGISGSSDSTDRFTVKDDSETHIAKTTGITLPAQYDDANYAATATRCQNTGRQLGRFSGFLVKQGRIRKNWKRRFFVLREETLSYYRRPIDEKPAGVIDVSAINHVPVVDNHTVGFKSDGTVSLEFGFNLSTAGREYILFTDSELLAERWVAEIANLHDVNAANHPTSSTPSTITEKNSLIDSPIAKGRDLDNVAEEDEMEFINQMVTDTRLKGRIENEERSRYRLATNEVKDVYHHANFEEHGKGNNKECADGESQCSSRMGEEKKRDHDDDRVRPRSVTIGADAYIGLNDPFITIGEAGTPVYMNVVAEVGEKSVEERDIQEMGNPDEG
eukprot:UC4_evm6s67